MILRILTRVAVGVALGGIVGNIVTGDWIYSIVWSVALGAIFPFGLLSGLRGARTLAAGYALARVETVQRSGEGTAASQPIEARLTVAPTATAPYATTLRADVPVDQLRTLTPGAILVVSRPSPVRPDVSLAPAPPAEWAARAAAARLDPSLIPPASQASDRIRPLRRGPAFRAASIAIILVAAVATLVPAFGSIARNVENIAVGDWNGNNLVTGRYQQLAVDEIVAVAGTTMCTDVSFYDSYVIAECLTRPGADTTDEYQWRYGRAFREGPALIQSTALDDELFDVSGLDFARVAASVKAGVAASGLTLTSGPYAWVARDFDGGGPVIHVSFGDDYKDASFDYSFDGDELSRSGSAFE